MVFFLKIIFPYHILKWKNLKNAIIFCPHWVLTRSCRWSIYRPPYFQLSETHKNKKKHILGFSFLPDDPYNLNLSSGEKVNHQRCFFLFLWFLGDWFIDHCFVFDTLMWPASRCDKSINYSCLRLIQTDHNLKFPIIAFMSVWPHFHCLTHTFDSLQFP